MANKKSILLVILAMPFILPLAYAASSVYYAKSTVYFNVPADASFAIAMPADYSSWTTITGTDETGATAVDWISFNFTNVPQSTLQEPYQLGDSANAQSGPTKPIFYIDNTGNVNEKFEIRIDSSLPTGVEMYFNATCTGTCTNPTTDLTAISTTYQTLVDSLPTDAYLNVTLYANVTSTASAGQSSVLLYIKSSAV